MLSVQEDTTFGPIYCECCGQKTQSISGWLNDDSGTVAAYLVHWTETRPDHGANFDLVIGKWGEATAASDRQGASLKYNRSGDGFMVIDASSRPFAAASHLFSHALSRQEVVGTPFAAELFTFIDAIWLQDSRIGEVRGDG